jgi:hypothetical protein
MPRYPQRNRKPPVQPDMVNSLEQALVLPPRHPDYWYISPSQPFVQEIKLRGVVGLVYASGEGRGSVVRVRDARRLTRVPSNLATFDLRAETMFWAVENPSPSISKCLDGGFVSYMFVSLLIDSLIFGIRARADGENIKFIMISYQR